MIRFLAIFFTVMLVLGLHARARLGDSMEQTIRRYGQPAGGTSQPGASASTTTFYASGLKIVCGYVANKVEMISYSRDDRDFVPQEIEALLRTNGRKIGWKPSDGFGPGTYTRADGVTATVTGEEVEIRTPVWTAALARDKAAADKAASAKAAQGNTATNTNTPTVP
jgi:hypothetical protein